LCISYLRSNIGHPAREEPSENPNAEAHTSLETGAKSRNYTGVRTS